MEALYKIKASEMDITFIQSVQKLFQEKDIVIRITSPANDTEYLSSYQANKNHIVDNMVAEPSVKFSSDEFEDYVSEKL